MVQINKSGLQQDDLGQPIIVTQGGLSGYTLIDRKKILFRLFLIPPFLSRVNSVFVRIKYPGQGIPDRSIVIPFGDLLIENSFPNGPSVGVIFRGNVFPDASIIYSVQFTIIGEGGVPLGVFIIRELKFLKSGRIRILAKAVESITRTAPWGHKIESNIFWLADLVDSMIRFGAMLPVSDGVFLGSNPSSDDGLAYIIGENIDAWPAVCPKGAAPSEPDKQYPEFLVCPEDEMKESILAEAKFWKSQNVRVDVTLAWRLRDATRPEPAGGNAVYNSAPDNGYATAVGGLQNGFETTASYMAQEIAHTFGIVSGDSPYTDGGGHSILVDLMDPTAFDFVRLKPYYPSDDPVADVMGIALGRGRDLTLFNEFDWERLRQRLVEISALTVKGESKKEKRKKMLDRVGAPFKGLQKIQVIHPKLTLSSKPGFDWHWTKNGFQSLKMRNPKANKSAFAPSAVNILSVLKKLEANDAYVPIDGKPLSIVITPIPRMNCQLEGI